jgi:putative transposase
MVEKIKGRKRHIITDVVGNILKVVVGVVNIYDTIVGWGVFKSVLEKKFPLLLGVCGDEVLGGLF